MAVEFLHSKKCIHSWINPREIAFEDERRTVKLNITPQAFQLKYSDSMLIENDTNIFYNCPEYLKEKSISFSYDIWCIGWTLYEMMTLNRNILLDLEKIKDFKRELANIKKAPNYYSTSLKNLFEK